MGLLQRFRSKFYSNAEQDAELSRELETGGAAEEPPTGAELVAEATYEHPTKGAPPPRPTRS